MARDLSIIIVNYNSGELLRNCLRSIERELSVDYEVVVVDNASSDDSIALCAIYDCNPRFKFIALERNEGFAKGCNIGADNATGQILHFLNPDTELRPGVNDDYLTAISCPDNVYVNPLVNRDGSIENGKMVMPVLGDIFWWNVCRSRARFWCKGASVILSAENFERLGRWSEDYFMYGEDLDLFYSMWRGGLKIMTLQTPIYHLGGGCSEKVWNSFDREVRVQRSFKLFYGKYFPKWKYVAVKCYFLLHNLIKHPSKVKGDIKAWNKV